MSRKKKNRKNKSYIKYVGFVVLCFGISLLVTSSYIFLSPFIFKKALISPVARNFKSSNRDVGALLEKQNIKFSSVLIATDSSYMISLASGETVIMSSKKDLKEQVLSLQIILSRLTIEGKRFKSLDFRFDKPVVLF